MSSTSGGAALGAARAVPPTSPLLLPLFFTSGAVGLVYQVVWLRQLILVFGATAFASSAVLSTFMGGLALGSWWAGRRADAWTAPPLRTYGQLELAIAGYAALIPWLMAAATPALELSWSFGAERHFVLFGLVKFFAIALLILPATTLMGATLPVLARAAARHAPLGSGVGALYAANTFGAVVGAAASAFVLLPHLGTRRTILLNIALNAAVGIVAWRLGSRGPDAASSARPTAEETAPPPRTRSLTWVFAASGFAAMVLEVAWTRGLALVLGSSVYAYAAMLTAFLLGLALGATAAARRIGRRPHADHARTLAVVLLGAGLCSLATAHALLLMPRLFAETYFRLDPSPDGWFMVQLGFALLVMFPTTFALGWIFPLVLELVGARRGIAASVGRVYAANTAGTIAGAAAGGFLFLPTWGVNATLIGVAAAQALLAAWVAFDVGAHRRTVLAGLCLAGTAGIGLLRPSWDVLLMNSGVYVAVQDVDREDGWQGYLERVRNDNELVFARDGLTSSVLVGRQPQADNLYLAVNGKTDASSREDLETQIVLGHLPLLIHPHPKEVLVVGLASGISAGSVACHPVDRIKVVEVEAAMIPAADLFRDHNGDVLHDPRVTISINDARNELQFNDAAYDVIISEPSNPWLTVASNLFTEDFFRVGRARLKPDGIYTQWIQTYGLGPAEVRSILASFHAVFPEVAVFETLNGVDLVVLGSAQPLRLDEARVGERMSELRVRMDLGRVRVRRPLDLLGMFQTGGAPLQHAIGGAIRNTDDNGLVEFAAPKTLYLDTQDANAAILQSGPEDPVEVVRDLYRGPQGGDALRADLIAVWRRRGHLERAQKAAQFVTDSTERERVRTLLEARR